MRPAPATSAELELCGKSRCTEATAAGDRAFPLCFNSLVAGSHGAVCRVYGACKRCWNAPPVFATSREWHPQRMKTRHRARKTDSRRIRLLSPLGENYAGYENHAGRHGSSCHGDRRQRMPSRSTNRNGLRCTGRADAGRSVNRALAGNRHRFENPRRCLHLRGFFLCLYWWCSARTRPWHRVRDTHPLRDLL